MSPCVLGKSQRPGCLYVLLLFFFGRSELCDQLLSASRQLQGRHDLREGGDLRPGHVRHGLRHRGGGAPEGQRHHLRTGLWSLHQVGGALSAFLLWR